MTKAMQKDYRVASTAKHYAIYSIAKGAREGQARTDPQATLHEVESIFLPPFKAAIKEARLLGVMSSYNDYDGVPVTGSHYWLIDRLRNEFGFRGYVVSDSAAVEYLYNKHGVAVDMKDAVRQWLWVQGWGPVFPAEVQVSNDERGRPCVAVELGENGTRDQLCAQTGELLARRDASQPGIIHGKEIGVVAAHPEAAAT